MDEKIVVRPPRWLWSGTVIFGFCGAYLSWMGLTSPKHMPTAGVLFFLMMGCGGLLLAVYFALYVGRERIEADTQKICWRGAFHKWQSASWGEVSDFYDATGADYKQDQSVVLFQDGRKLTFNVYLESFFALKNAVAQRATATGKTEWESRNLKGGSTPTSAQASPGIKAMLVGCFVTMGLCMGWMGLWMPGEKVLRSGSTGPSDVWGWAMLITLELLCLPMLALSVVGMVTLIRTERPRSVHFNEQGFRVEEKGCASWQARWDEIVAIKRYWNGKRLETPHGVFYATTSLNHYRAFTEVMDANLPAHLTKFLEVPVQTQGDVQIFRYVHSGYRGVLLFPLLIGILQPGARLIYGALDMEFRPNLALTDYSIAGTLILIGVWGLWRMYGARIEISDSGITQVGLNGTTRLRWTDIERGRVIGSDSLAWYELSGAGRQVRWWAGLPNGKLLREEITRRLPENIVIDWK
ncbi:MAG: hypothetical protein QM758_02095 [Armatimonas sp.]